MARNNINLHILNASGKLTPYIKEIEDIFNEAVSKVISKIPISNVDVVIVSNPFFAIPEDGVGGHTYTSNYVAIPLNTKAPHFSDTFHLELMNAIAHEFSHVTRWQYIGYPYSTLLDALITEGLADCFAVEITGRKTIHAKNRALIGEQIKNLLKRARQEFNKKFSYSMPREWFSGSKEKRIPRWTGYTLGYNLVAEYLKKHPDKKPSQLHNLKAEEFIE